MNNHRGSATEPNNGVAQTRQHLQIMVGEQVQKDGTVYRISQVLDFETVIGIAVESGRSCPLRIKELAPLNSGSVSPEQDMSEIGDTDWREAEHRFSIIKPWWIAIRWGGMQRRSVRNKRGLIRLRSTVG